MASLLIARYFCSRGGGQHRKQKKKTDKSGDDVEVSMEFFSLSATQQPHKSSVVRIVLAGGLAELYAGAVSARLVMERYPVLCLVRPDVFRRPEQSLVSPGERLLPGQNFYLLPRSTVDRLMRQKSVNVSPTSDAGTERNHRGQALGTEAKPEEKLGDRTEDDDAECARDGYAMCSAKDFYLSRERWVRCSMKRWERSETDKEREQKQKKQPASPPPRRQPCLLRSMRTMRLLGRWKPNLSPVLELSPY